ncbi:MULTISPECIES: hypothetical protein [unclassified Leucobacter]|uniref:hypothetical protein n=1 Tax=unclassified Leucobacter TaxID=2621730 RepID=UPI00301950FD
MGRRIPGKLLPHRGLVIVEPHLGGGANGRAYGPPITVARAQIVDVRAKAGDQYDGQRIATGTVYFERSALAEIPPLESRVTLWAGTSDESTGTVEAVTRYEHPRIADLLEVKLR